MPVSSNDLAIQRTKFANQRTYLAYMRTGFGIAGIAGIACIAGIAGIAGIACVCWIASIACMGYGAFRLSQGGMTWLPLVVIYFAAVILMLSYDHGPKTKNSGLIGNISISLMGGAVI